MSDYLKMKQIKMKAVGPHGVSTAQHPKYRAYFTMVLELYGVIEGVRKLRGPSACCMHIYMCM